MKHKLISRRSKADCLAAAGVNIEKKAKAKNLDDIERKNLRNQAENLRHEAQRHLSAADVHGDTMTTRMVNDQAAKE